MNPNFARPFARCIAAILLTTLSLVAAAGAPYVRPDPDGGWIARRLLEGEAGATVQTWHIASDRTLVVDSVGRVPAFQVRLREPAVTAPDALNLESAAALFVVADIHGEYDILVELLRRQGIIDDALHWRFEQGHLVFLGDVFDRGAHQVEVLWLIYQLQGEAAAAGGSVEFLLGNHELMTLRGDARYLHPRYPAEAQALGVSAYADLFDAGSVLGQWLRTRAAILRAGDVLLVHGGISPQTSARGFTSAQLSRAVREVLAGQVDPDASPLHDFAIRSSGPLWYRGYFPRDQAPPEASLAQVEALRRHWRVRAILVGHTALKDVSALFGGRVIGVQIYPERNPETGAAVMGAVCRVQGHWYRANVDGSRTPLELAPAGAGI